jgi:tape measure domain-containing protein
VANRTQILVSARDQASSVFGRVAKNSTRAQKNIFGVNNALRATDKSISSLSSSVKGLVGGVGAGLGISAIFGSVKDAIAIKVEYDKINNVLKAVTGSSKAAAKEFKFLSEESERLGIQLRPLAQSYTRLAAAGNLLGLTTDNTREIFTSFSEALTGFGATREQSIRVFTAIEQILSKGKVSAEELRQQLGEALPGSFQLAAKAAGVTVQELDGMLKRGELLSKDFILPFARAVRSEFGGAAVEGAKLLNAEFSRTINTLDQVKLAFVEGGDAGSTLSDSLARILKSFREFLSDEDRLKRIAEAGVQFGAAMEIAAKAIQKIANVVSSIPSEALIALGGLALTRGRGGSLSTSTSKLGILGSSTGLNQAVQSSPFLFGAGGRVEGIIKSDRARGANRLSGLISGRTSYENKIAAQRFRDVQLSRGVVQGAQDPQLFGGVVQRTGAKALNGFGKTVTSVGKTFAGLITPLNLAIGAFGVLGSKLIEINQLNAQTARTEAEIEKQTVLDQATVLLGLQRKAGNKSIDAELLLQDARAALAKSGVIKVVSDEMLKSLEAPLQRIIDKGNEAAPVIKKVIDPVIAVIEKFKEGTAEIGRRTSEVGTLGTKGADRQERIRRYTALLEKENHTRKESIELATKRVDAEDKLNKAKKSQNTIEAAKNVIGTLRDEVDVRKKFKGRSKEFIEEQVKLVKLIRDMVTKGVSLPTAKALAREQINLEGQLKNRGTRVQAQDLAVGAATSARSTQNVLRKQQQQGEARAARMQNALDEIASGVTNLNDKLDNFDVDFR